MAPSLPTRFLIITLTAAGFAHIALQPANAVEFQLGDLAPKFDPPGLDELNRANEWIERPVDSSLERLRRRQATEKQLVSVEEALRLKNDSAENNRKILSALGRLPENDDDIDWDATWRRALPGHVHSFNPLLASSAAEFEISTLTSFGLFSFDWNFEPFAAREVVESWHVSKDGLADRIILRKGLTWSDDKPITAHDVEFSYQVIMTSAVPIRAQRHGTDQLLAVKAYDDQTLVFFHKEKLATNHWNMNFSIIPKHIYQDSLREDPTFETSEYHRGLEEDPVVGGAYEIASKEFDVLTLKRRDIDLEFSEKAYFKEIVFHVLPEREQLLKAQVAGKIEETYLTTDQWRDQTGDEEFYAKNTKAYGLEYTYFYFGWNCRSRYFEDRRVRQAMTLAFDQEKMLKDLRHGLDEPCTGIFHPDSRWSPQMRPTPPPRDIARAKRLLDEAGWRDHDEDGIRDKVVRGERQPFRFTMLTRNVDDRVAICNLLRENLAELGIDCRVRPVESATLQDKTFNRDFDAAFSGWGTGADPDTQTSLWKSDELRNFVSYQNKEVDELFEQGRRELDPKRRAEIYGKIHQILWRDQPYTWLYYRNAYHAFSKDLRGYNFSPRGVFGYGPGAASLWKPAKR